jgi:glycosyltransferase involved in cell wall biosynthesis
MLYINGRFLGHKMDGISRFSLEICKKLKDNGLVFTVVIPKWLEYDNDEGFEILKYGNFKSHFWEQIDLLRFLKKRKYPLLLNLSGLGPLYYKNQIITIHDLSFYENRKWFSRSYAFFYSFVTPILAKTARKIITVSNFSKNEILKYLKVDEEKIEVVFNAVATNLEVNLETYKMSSQIKSIVKDKYILAVCSIDPRKNLQRLIDGFIELNLDGFKLVLVGKTSKHFNVKLISNSDSVVFTGFLSDSDLCVLYKKCQFFVYPSLYEGFGIPPLEAMKNGCPVIVSNIPSLKEVCEDAAIYVDPFDVQSIKNGIMRLINQPLLQEELRLKGNSRSDFFSWDDSGKKVYNLVKKIST